MWHYVSKKTLLQKAYLDELIRRTHLTNTAFVQRALFPPASGSS